MKNGFWQVLIFLFSFSFSYAHAGVQVLNVNSRSCTSGAPFTPDPATPENSFMQNARSFSVTSDLGRIEIEGVSFVLAPTGKNTFLASPENSQAPARPFFVRIHESEVSIFSSDFLGRSCGGGLVQTILAE